MARDFYIVYRGLQRYRDGSVKPRTRVRKLRNVDGRPRIVGKRVINGELWVDVEIPQRYTARDGSKYTRKVVRSVHLGRVKSVRAARPRLTTKPPKGPKVDRRRGRRRR